MNLNDGLFGCLGERYQDKVGDDEYQREELLLDELPDKFNEGTWELDDIVTILEWKNEKRFREHNISRFLENNSEREIQKFVDGAIKHRNLTNKLESLRELEQIGVATSSAILLFMDPGRYTVFDTKAWDVLRESNLVSADYDSDSIEQYLLYLGICRALAAQYDVELRDLDRMLWVIGGEL